MPKIDTASTVKSRRAATKARDEESLALAIEPEAALGPGTAERPRERFDPPRLHRRTGIPPVLYLLVGAALVLFALWAVNPVPCSDLWWQMKTGELIWNERAIPQTDRFSFMAAGRPWIIQEWATSVIFYLMFTKISPSAMVLFKMLAFATAMGLGLSAAWTRCRNGLIAVATALGVGYAAHFFADMRPQMVSFACLAALLLLLERDRAVPGSRARWLLPPLMLLWVNVHAAFMAGVSVLLAVLVGELLEAWWVQPRHGTTDSRLAPGRWRRLLLPIGLALLATWINPYGPRIYLYPFTLLRHNSMIKFVQEWFSPDFHAPYLLGYELCLFLLPAALIASARRRRPADMLLLLFWAHQSFQSRRHIPVFLLIALPVLAEHLAGAAESVRARLRERAPVSCAGAGRQVAAPGGPPDVHAGGWRLAAGALILLISVGIGRAVQSLPRSDLFEYSAGLAFFPRAACDFIEREGWTGRMYNEFDWGGYCIWRFYPRQQVFIDGRCEVYFDGAWENHQALHYAQADWEGRLRAARIDTLLVNPDSYLNRVLPTSRQWQRVYGDPQALVYRRKQPFAP